VLLWVGTCLTIGQATNGSFQLEVDSSLSRSRPYLPIPSTCLYPSHTPEPSVARSIGYMCLSGIDIAPLGTVFSGRRLGQNQRAPSRLTLLR
jgi:hypothetical protein